MKKKVKKKEEYEGKMTAEKMRKIFIALQVSGLSQRTLVAAPL